MAMATNRIPMMPTIRMNTRATTISTITANNNMKEKATMMSRKLAWKTKNRDQYIDFSVVTTTQMPAIRITKTVAIMKATRGTRTMTIMTNTTIKALVVSNNIKVNGLDDVARTQKKIRRLSATSQ